MTNLDSAGVVVREPGDVVARAPRAIRDRLLRAHAFKHILLALFAIGMVYPLLWMLSASFKPSEEIFSSPGLWSDQWTLQNYIDGWNAVEGGFGLLFLNSFIVCVLCIIGNVLSCSFAAYSFARLEFVGRKFWFAIMLATVMLPHHVLIIPQYVLFSRLHWINTFLPLVVPKFLATDAFFVFLMVQFMRALPRELDDAARVDGCGPYSIYWRIIVPLMLPAMATTAAFTFIWTWNDFFTPLVYLTRPSLFTVPLGLNAFQDSTGDSSLGGLFAMGTLSLGPVLGFFIIAQKYLVRGFATTGLK
jgi:multiple sugar transport system permease protein